MRLEAFKHRVILCVCQREREHLVEQKQHVQHLVNNSKSIVRLKPRNPEEKSTSPVIVQALCDFRQDQVKHECPLTVLYPKTFSHILSLGMVTLRPSE